MNAVDTKNIQVLKLSVDHKNLSTEVTAEARHRHTRLSDISKYYIGSFKATGIPQSGKSKGRIPQLWGKLSNRKPRGQGVERMKLKYKQGEWPENQPVNSNIIALRQSRAQSTVKRLLAGPFLNEF